MAENKRNFLLRMFGRSQGDRGVASQFMADDGVTEEQVTNLAPEQIDQAFEAYKRAHEANGIEYTTDRGGFERNLRGNLIIAHNLSKILKKRG